MACFREQVLFCEHCKREENLPVCCGKEMEFDGTSFFCDICGREIKKIPQCCSATMQVRSSLRNIKQDIFKAQ
ncbi:MAG: hypothetical protein JW904_11230 [Spirochaetales bacterium]|nr:hypothetical protein [Spirochaetales bacterium]